VISMNSHLSNCLMLAINIVLILKPHKVTMSLRLLYFVNGDTEAVLLNAPTLAGTNKVVEDNFG